MPTDIELIDRCSIEELERAGLRMYQLQDGFRFGTDSTLLAWFAASFLRRGRRGNRVRQVLELGAGCGACSLLLLGRNPMVHVDSVEIMEDPSRVMSMNIQMNNLEDRMNAYCMDIRELDEPIKTKQYDVIMMNPPFFSRDRGPATSEDKSVERLNGRFEENGTLEDFVKVAASRVLPSSGYIVMIMRANRLADSIQSFINNKVVPTHLINVHPFEDKSATMILLAGRRGVNSNEMKVLPPLVLNHRTSDGCIYPSDKLVEIYDEEHKECLI